MSDTAKKWLISIGIIILALAIGFLIYWCVSNYEKVKEGFKGTGLYTAADLEKAKMEGYQEGANSLQELEKQIQNFKSQLDTKTKTINELTDKVNALTSENKELYTSNEENKQKIAELQVEVANQQSKINELNQKITNLKQDKLVLESQLNQSNLKNADYEREINNLNNQVSDLNQTITTLNSEISRLKDILAEYEISYEQQVFAVYKVGDHIWKTQLYRKNDTLSLEETPTKDFCEFTGWTLNGEVINLSEIQIEKDLVLEAKFRVLESAFLFTGLDQNGNITTDESQITEYIIGRSLSQNGFVGGPLPIGYFGKGLTIIEIPSKYNNKPVVAIGSCAFVECQEVKELILPNTIRIIGQGAFWLCKNLEKINFPNSLNEIHLRAFEGCKSLNNVSLPSSIISIGYGAFAACSSLSQIEFNCNIEIIPNRCFERTAIEIFICPASVKEIGVSAFANCSSLYKVVFNEGLKTIGEQAFFNCIRMGYIDIPSTITNVGKNSFSFSTTGIDLVIRTQEFCGELIKAFSSSLNDCKVNNRLYVLADLKDLYSSSEYKRKFERFYTIDELDSTTSDKYLAFKKF